MILTHLGLADKDIALLRSVFSISKELQQNYTLVGTEKRRTPGRLADILLLNGDDEEAMKIWGVLENVSKNTTPVIVTSSRSDFADRHVLRRPLTPRRVIAVLAGVAVSKSGVAA